jgi:small subunit ribosomal protein S17
MPKRLVTGVVTRDKAAKTRRVEIPRLVRHATYGKTLRRRTVCYAHDEENISKIGDTVEIEESPPLSKLKRWVVKRVVSQAKQAGPEVAALDVSGDTPKSNDEKQMTKE